MQKKLIALAVAGLASSAAFAQSNVTIYGLLQPSYDFVDVKETDGTKQKLSTMNWNASRVGFKGEEALGNGLKAIFQLETYFDLTNDGDDGSAGSGGFVGSRDSWVGLAGSFGSITFGAHDNALKKTFAKYDVWADSLGDYNNIFSNGVGSRDSNSTYYTSPRWSGFQLSANYAFDGVKDSGEANIDNSKYAIAGDYTVGGLSITAGYGHGNADAGAVEGNEKTTRIGGMYTFPGIGTKLSLIWSQDKAEAAGVDAKVNQWMIGAWQPVAANLEIGATYLKAGDVKGTVGIADSGARNWNLGAKYSLSKRTNVLAVYTNLKNDTNAAYGLDAGYDPVGAGAKLSGFSVRLQHAF